MQIYMGKKLGVQPIFPRCNRRSLGLATSGPIRGPRHIPSDKLGTISQTMDRFVLHHRSLDTAFWSVSAVKVLRGMSVRYDPRRGYRDGRWMCIP